MKTTGFFKSIVSGFMILISTTLIAQKLPNIQEGSVLAPAKVKIDGNGGEWGSQLKASNKSTMVDYTLANDNNNLYLVIQAGTIDIIRKIFVGGITLKVQNPGKNNEAIPLSITYPNLPAGKNKGRVFSFLQDTAKLSPAILVDLNNTLEEASNQIFIAGIKGIPDSVSVYNEHGIKVAQNLNSKRVYTYELALPLKYLSGIINTEGGFKYNIILNGPKIINYIIDGKPYAANSPEVQAIIERFTQSDPYYSSLNTPTDLSGTYQLFK